MISETIEKLGGHVYLRASLKDNTQWLLKSFEVCKNLGSSAYRTSWGHWSRLYPETTGYLLRSTQLGKEFSEASTKTVVPYLISLQNPDGSLNDPTTNELLNVFDLSQITLGILHQYKLHAQSKNKDIGGLNKAKQFLERAYQWMASDMDPSGQFNSHNYIKSYNPSYYARVAWSLLLLENFLVLDNQTSRKLLQYVVSLQNENLSFRNWGLYPDHHGLTHTIAYTLRGLWECGIIFKNLDLQSRVKDTMLHLSQLITSKNKVAASYDQHWKGDYSYLCSTGNAQLAFLFLEVGYTMEDNSFFCPLHILLSPLVNAQRKRFFNKGAIPSSIPVWGKYQRFRYTNWTQKFYNDAIDKLLKVDQKINGPT